MLALKGVVNGIIVSRRLCYCYILLPHSTMKTGLAFGILLHMAVEGQQGGLVRLEHALVGYFVCESNLCCRLLRLTGMACRKSEDGLFLKVIRGFCLSAIWMEFINNNKKSMQIRLITRYGKEHLIEIDN
jgi:hypothetical protein